MADRVIVLDTNAIIKLFAGSVSTANKHRVESAINCLKGPRSLINHPREA